MRLSIALVFLAIAGSAMGKRVEWDYASRDRKALKLDLFLPNTPPPPHGYPLIVSFHGGGWALGNKHNDLFLKPLLDKGYALASVDYRLSRYAPFPAQIEDAREAVQWLLRQAKTLKLDRNRIAATGISAGAHLALLLAFSENHRFVQNGSPPLPAHTIKAVVAFYPPTDLISIVPPRNRDNPGNLVALLLGGPVSEHLPLARAASPITYIKPGLPPVLLIHGDRDRLVPLSQSITLSQALRKNRNPVELIVYAGRGHAFRPTPQTFAAIETFLKVHLAPIP